MFAASLQQGLHLFGVNRAHRRGRGSFSRASAARLVGRHPVLVNYWATWCDPCRDEFPDLVKIDQDYRSKGLDFIAITLDDLADIKTAVPKFLLAMNAKMPVYLLNVADPEPAINMVDSNWSG